MLVGSAYAAAVCVLAAGTYAVDVCPVLKLLLAGTLATLCVFTGAFDVEGTPPLPLLVPLVRREEAAAVKQKEVKVKVQV